MATTAEWVAGARPRTLPAAISPVLVGTGAAAAEGTANLALAVLALIVALSLQVAVNYANDYSDGIRGTDQDRVGPVRLVGQRLADPGNVKLMAFAFFGLAALAGLALVALSNTLPLLLLGALAIVAAWRYTGGNKPYGYRGLGEVNVFVFFGLVATLGTAYTQAHTVTWAAVLGACAIGALASAILVANNLRDIPGDTVAGKRTLAVRLGDRRSRSMYVALVLIAFLLGAYSALWAPWAVLTVAALPLGIRNFQRLAGGAQGRELIPVLSATGWLELLYAVLLSTGLALAAS
ncbi:MAG: 1,4-dihydroxy-2-naphthoate polyprenyltransferase [Tetrasphaera sp.]